MPTIAPAMSSWTRTARPPSIGRMCSVADCGATPAMVRRQGRSEKVWRADHPGAVWAWWWCDRHRATELTPPEVAAAVKALVDQNRGRARPAAQKGAKPKTSWRILKSGQLLPPDLYAALHGQRRARQTNDRQRPAREPSPFDVRGRSSSWCALRSCSPAVAGGHASTSGSTGFWRAAQGGGLDAAAYSVCWRLKQAKPADALRLRPDPLERT